MRWLNQTKLETREHAIAVGIILALTILFFLPLLRGRTFNMVGAHMRAQYPWIGITPANPEIKGLGYPQTDHAEGLYPTSMFATKALRSGEFPMWSPYSFSGVPIMEAGVGNGLLYPPQLIAMIVFSPARQHDFLLFTHLLLAGLGMYALLRCWGVNLLGALFGAIVWQLNGHNTFFLIFEFVGIAAAWFPLMLLCATLAIRKQSWRWALAMGIAWGMSILHGVQHWEYLGTVTAGSWYFGLAIAAARRSWQEGQRRTALSCLTLLVISGLTAAALSAASWLSLASLLSHVHREPFTLEAQIAGSFTLRAVVRALVFPLSAAGNDKMGVADYASFGFIGIPALIFVPAGFLRRSTLITFAGIVGLVSLAMIFGIRPLYIFFRLVLPYFGAMRPHDAFYLFCFACSVLSAFGISELCRRFAAGSLGLFLRVFGVLLIAVECGQLMMFGWIINPQQPVKSQWLFPETPLISKLKSVQGEYHFLPVSYHDPAGRWTPPVFAGKSNVGFDLRSSSGYESLLPLSTAMLWRAVEKGGVITRNLSPGPRPYFYHDQLPLDLLEKLSVGFMVTPPNTEPRDVKGSNLVADGSVELVYQGPDGWIYRVPRALPRAFVVPTILTVPDAETSLRTLIDEKFDARRAAIVIAESQTGLPSFDPAVTESGGTCSIITDRLNDVEIEVSTPRPGMLVLNDSWDAGWKARIDGIEQPVLQANYAFRGVVVPPGNHRVTFLYRPRLLLIGIYISVATMLLLAIAGIGFGVRRLRGLHSARISGRRRQSPEKIDKPVMARVAGNSFVPPGHFYSPIPSRDEVRRDEKKIFNIPEEVAGVDLNLQEQLLTLAALADYYKELPFHAEKAAGLRYWFENSMYSYSDAICLYAMIRHLKPRQIIEVGSGYSSCVMLDTNELFFDQRISCTFIEPNPREFLSLLKVGDLQTIDLVPSRLQEVSLDRFTSLSANDILFIDSSHVSKVGSDVNYLIFEILPVLQSGVYVHFHDVFYPFEYPKQWICDLGIAWNEAYLVRSFLQYNAAFRIAFFNTYLEHFHEERFKELMPLCLNNKGGSLWLRKL
ncbi:MAG TPA: YfhO family protein [Pyrinomonadaceae bacterium]|nr:YfhO family protein [Pyrinomonadaceae bacterium]